MLVVYQRGSITENCKKWAEDGKKAVCWWRWEKKDEDMSSCEAAEMEGWWRRSCARCKRSVWTTCDQVWVRRDGCYSQQPTMVSTLRFLPPITPFTAFFSPQSFCPSFSFSTPPHPHPLLFLKFPLSNFSRGRQIGCFLWPTTSFLQLVNQNS